MRWTIGIIAFFVTVIAMNVVYVIAATSGADPVDPSYAGSRK